MKVICLCPACENTVNVELTVLSEGIECPACGKPIPVEVPPAATDEVLECPMCGCPELFVRKDFSQRIGVSIVIIGIVGSSIAWGFHMTYTAFGVLFGTALIDVLLYFMVGNMLQCYRCHAGYRGLKGLESAAPFDLEIHEKFRQQAIRLREARVGK